MAADVLAFNAIQEVNEELRAQIAEVKASITANEASGGGGTSETDLQKKIRLGFKQNPHYFGCLIPKQPAEGGDFNNGIQLCNNAGNYWRCGQGCTWTVPSGVTCARFQIWGPGSTSGSSCCCGVGMPGTSGAYASVIIPVQSGQQYTMCAGCAYCCYVCFSNVQPGASSYVQGSGLNNFCAMGGDNCYCQMVKHYGVCAGLTCTFNQFWCCQFMGLCPISQNDLCLCDSIPASNWGYGRSHNRMQCPMIYNEGTKFYGSATTGDVYGYNGMYSQYHVRDGLGWQVKYPPVYGWAGCYDNGTCSCSTEGCCIWNSGCCRKAEYGYRYVPSGPGALSMKCGGHTNDPFGDSGRMGHACVSWKS